MLRTKGDAVGKVLSSGARLPCKGGSNGNDYPFRCGVACTRVIGGVGAAGDRNLRCGTTSRRYRRAVARDAANRRRSARGRRSTDCWIRTGLNKVADDGVSTKTAGAAPCSKAARRLTAQLPALGFLSVAGRRRFADRRDVDIQLRHRAVGP